MNEQIRQIAERIRGLRDALDIDTAETAMKVGISREDYEKYESGNSDIPMSVIYGIAQTFGIDISVLLSGEEPHSKSFFVTRKGTGVSVERTKIYKYQALAYGFKSAKAEPFEVTIEPNDTPIHLNTHPGQEFNLILEGTLNVFIAGNEIILNEGDSIYFDSNKPHGMKALSDKVRLLAIII